MTPVRTRLAASVIAAVLVGLATWALVAGFFDTTPTGAGGAEIVRPDSLPDRPQWLPDAGICGLAVGAAVLILALGYLTCAQLAELNYRRGAETSTSTPQRR